MATLDPLCSSADPEQNSTSATTISRPSTFERDVYWYANVLDHDTGPLRDRMKLSICQLHHSGKLQIARRYLIARQLEATVLKPEHARSTMCSDKIIGGLVTREAGVAILTRDL